MKLQFERVFSRQMLYCMKNTMGIWSPSAQIPLRDRWLAAGTTSNFMDCSHRIHDIIHISHWLRSSRGHVSPQDLCWPVYVECNRDKGHWQPDVSYPSLDIRSVSSEHQAQLPTTACWLDQMFVTSGTWPRRHDHHIFTVHNWKVL